MIILGIETSCDDTCIAVLEIKNWKLKILSNVISSQVKLHAKYGGIYPSLAKREHQKNLTIVLKKVLKEAKSPKVDLIAVTKGPGLDPCLWVGINFAEQLAEKWKIPIIPINHIEAHIFANFIERESALSKFFPAICLVVSGGHTQLILMKGFGRYTILGETRDDAAGECFDKTARILGLGYPGGVKISDIAAKFQIPDSRLQIKLPRPMIYQKNYDFSFSGLKTAVLYDFKNRSQKIRKSKKYIQEMCYEIQEAIIDVLIRKTLLAAKNYKAKTIILGGGVTANNELQKQFQLAINNQRLVINFLVPAKKFCTDNAAMIAITAYYHWLKEKKSKIKKGKKIKANANLRIN